MTKGRNSTLISIRLPDELYFKLVEWAAWAGISPGECLKNIVVKELAPKERD